ncbi:MAG: RNA degradosome polyphosphate kinase [Rhodobacteraceae bacterium]|nr:RNA degradosome polyphosphate kinase [Paracoccaceae bacterium]
MTGKDKAETALSDFLNGPFAEPRTVRAARAESPKRFINRELSWLAFNWRVLEEAGNVNVPLLERVRFLSISATNFEEFYSVRAAGLMALAAAGNHPAAADGRLPSEQLVEIEKSSRRLFDEQIAVWVTLRTALGREGIHILDRDQLTAGDRTYLDRVFIDEVFPVLTPLAIDPAHPFPFIPNAGFTMAIRLSRDADGKSLLALLPIPLQINRFVRLPSDILNESRFVPLEDVLLEKIGFIFPGYSVTEQCVFRVLRDSDLEYEEEAEDLVREFETALKRRRRGNVILVLMSQSSQDDLQNLVLRELEFARDRVFELPGMIGMADLKELVLDERPDLLWPRFSPRIPERVEEHNGDIFAAVRSKDMLLHHPYETFDMVVRFLRQAAQDPNVVAIKQTLYRTSINSPIVEALCEAAEAGKSVTALVEIKARFDEAANIRQSRMLERSGAHVVYGFINLKTHAKVSSVIRREGVRLVTYTHFGTGNYHPITAKIYTDLSFFTCDDAIGRDGTRLINYVSGYARPETLEHLAIAPINLRAVLLMRIREETENARKGKPAEIWAKLNALIDPEIIDALYAASSAGVKVSLIVRGICGLRPGIRGLSENIRVKSIVGRFLEHARILSFGNGQTLPSKKAVVYVSSADWMQRNLDRRVETLVEISNPTVRDQIMSQVLAANLADVAQSWVLQPDGTYRRERDSITESSFSCHKFFMENPSLSGRGTARSKSGIRLAHAKD